MSNGQKSFKQQSATPTRKVMAGTLAGAITTIVVWGINTYWPIPNAISEAIPIVVFFIVSYIVPPAARDQIVQP